MTAPVGFIDFFVLEASDYVEQLDAVLLAAGDTGPELDGMQRSARALRGSATMAKLPAFAEIATGIERVARALRDGSLRWDRALSGALTAAVDDAKLLLRNVRAWSPQDDARARARVDELLRFAPRVAATPLTTATTAAHDSYLVSETANIGAGLELLATRPTDRDAGANVLRRVRALRGIASVKDHPALADVLQGAEQAAHPLELGQATLDDQRLAVLRAASMVLRAISDAMRAGDALDSAAPALTTFATALDAMHEHASDAERVVPIAELFYDDGGETIVERAANPPTSSAERFRLEVVSQGEHLRRLVGDARAARDELARDRVRRALRQTLRSLHHAAESFGEATVADFISSHNDAAVTLDVRALDSLDEMASLLAQPVGATTSISDRVSALSSARHAAPPEAPGEVPVASSAEAPAPVASRMTPIAPPPAHARPSTQPQERIAPAAAAVGAMAASAPAAPQSLGALLETGISRLGALHHSPLSAPVPIAEQPPVPIEVLLYRGRAAIDRCIVIRDELRQSDAPLDANALGELFDLLDLALTD